MVVFGYGRKHLGCVRVLNPWFSKGTAQCDMDRSGCFSEKSCEMRLQHLLRRVRRRALIIRNEAGTRRSSRSPGSKHVQLLQLGGSERSVLSYRSNRTCKLQHLHCISERARLWLLLFKCLRFPALLGRESRQLGEGCIGGGTGSSPDATSVGGEDVHATWGFRTSTSSAW